jgi:hypothetical protein
MSHPQEWAPTRPLAAPSFRLQGLVPTGGPTPHRLYFHGLHGVRPGRVPAAQQRHGMVDHLAVVAELMSHVSHGLPSVSQVGPMPTRFVNYFRSFSPVACDTCDTSRSVAGSSVCVFCPKGKPLAKDSFARGSQRQPRGESQTWLAANRSIPPMRQLSHQSIAVIMYWDWGIVVAGMEADHEQGPWMVRP